MSPFCGTFDCENKPEENCTWDDTYNLFCNWNPPLTSAILLPDIEPNTTEYFRLPSGTNQAPNKHITLVFNSFVLMTLFNEINCRNLNGKRNIFAGIHRNFIFLAIWIGSFIVQVPMRTDSDLG